MKSVWVLVAAFVVLLVVAVLEPRVTVLSAVLAIAFFVSWLVLRHRSHRRGIESPSPSPNIAALPAGILAFGSGGHDLSSSHSSPIDASASCGGGADGGSGTCP